MKLTYEQAIETAKANARAFKEPCIVYSYKPHWWSFTRYGYCFEVNYVYIAARLLYTLTRRLKIMPGGAIVQ